MPKIWERREEEGTGAVVRNKNVELTGEEGEMEGKGWKLTFSWNRS